MFFSDKVRTWVAFPQYTGGLVGHFVWPRPVLPTFANPLLLLCCSCSLAVPSVLREKEVNMRSFSMSCAGDIPRESCSLCDPVELAIRPAGRCQSGCCWVSLEGQLSASFIFLGGNSIAAGKRQSPRCLECCGNGHLHPHPLRMLWSSFDCNVGPCPPGLA